ncbi:MAG: hypothetical protein ACKO96_05130 [Flammeovirgaceae bacterium]
MGTKANRVLGEVMSILDDIATVLNSPQAQEGMRAFSRIGMPLELVQRDKENYTQQRKLDMLEQQEMQKQQRQAIASQMLANIMKDGVPDSEKLAALAQFDPDMAMQMYKQAQKQSASQQKVQQLMSLGYDERTANEVALGLIDNAVDARGNPILINRASGASTPITPQGAQSQDGSMSWQPYNEEAVIGGNQEDDYPDINTLFNMEPPTNNKTPAQSIDGDIAVSELPTLESVAKKYGYDLLNPTDAKSASRVFNDKLKTYKENAEKNINTSKNKAKAQGMAAQFNLVNKTIDNAIKSIDEDSFFSPRTGFLGSTLAELPFGTEAKGLKGYLDTIKSSIGFDKLQNIRDNSPTGGALGQVAVQELDMLQKTYSSLEQSQSKAQLKANLLTVKNSYAASIKRLKDAYIQDYGTLKGFDKYFTNVVSPNKAAKSGGGNLPQIGAIEDGHIFKGGNPADPNNWEKVR